VVAEAGAVEVDAVDLAAVEEDTKEDGKEDTEEVTEEDSLTLTVTTPVDTGTDREDDTSHIETDSPCQPFPRILTVILSAKLRNFPAIFKPFITQHSHLSANA